MGPFEILCLFTAIFLFLYYYTTSTHNVWKNRGVQGPKPSPFFGNVKDLMFNRLFIGDFVKNIYESFKDEPMVGIFSIKSPILILRDPELIKDVLIKDFNKFSDRGITFHEKIDVLSPHLFALEPKRWRPLRKNLSPIFTSGKLKEMFHLLLESADELEKYLEKIVPQNKPVECRQLTSKFTIDVIGSCAFGIDINSLSDEKNDFLRMGRKIFDVSFRKSIQVKIRDTTPWLYEVLGHLLTDTELSNFFVNLIKDTIGYRKKNNVVRHDFVDSLKHITENPDRLGDMGKKFSL